MDDSFAVVSRAFVVTAGMGCLVAAGTGFGSRQAVASETLVAAAATSVAAAEGWRTALFAALDAEMALFAASGAKVKLAVVLTVVADVESYVAAGEA